MSNNVATASGDKHKCGVAELMGRVEGDEVIFEGICCGGNIRRKSLLASGKPRDFTGKVVVVTNPDFDIEKTIFNPLRGVLQRAVIKAKLGVRASACRIPSLQLRAHAGSLCLLGLANCTPSQSVCVPM